MEGSNGFFRAVGFVAAVRGGCMRYKVVPRPRIRVRRSFGNTCGSVLPDHHHTRIIFFDDDYVAAPQDNKKIICLAPAPDRPRHTT